MHLTNDAVQKKSEDYGKYENGNKVSFADFEKYLEASCPEKDCSFYGEVYPKMMVRMQPLSDWPPTPSAASTPSSTPATASSPSRSSASTS